MNDFLLQLAGGMTAAAIICLVEYLVGVWYFKNWVWPWCWDWPWRD